MATTSEKVMVDLDGDSPGTSPLAKPHGKGPAAPEATDADDEDLGSWVETLMIWRDLKHPEVEPTFVLDDSAELNLWVSLRDTGRGAMSAINKLAETMGYDFFKLTQVCQCHPLRLIFFIMVYLLSQICVHLIFRSL